MPSSFLRYAADGDGDGRIDIWNNIDDVFASTARYLSKEGWQAGIGWGREVKLPAGFNRAELGLKDAQARSVNARNNAGCVVRMAVRCRMPFSAVGSSRRMTCRGGRSRSMIIFAPSCTGIALTISPSPWV